MVCPAVSHPKHALCNVLRKLRACPSAHFSHSRSSLYQVTPLGFVQTLNAPYNKLWDWTQKRYMICLILQSWRNKIQTQAVWKRKKKSLFQIAMRYRLLNWRFILLFLNPTGTLGFFLAYNPKCSHVMCLRRPNLKSSTCNKFTHDHRKQHWSNDDHLGN